MPEVVRCLLDVVEPEGRTDSHRQKNGQEGFAYSSDDALRCQGGPSPRYMICARMFAEYHGTIHVNRGKFKASLVLSCRVKLADGDFPFNQVIPCRFFHTHVITTGKRFQERVHNIHLFTISPVRWVDQRTVALQLRCNISASAANDPTPLSRRSLLKSVPIFQKQRISRSRNLFIEVRLTMPSGGKQC